MKNKTKVYLASPWFSAKQKEVMDKVRNLLLEMDFDVFAPFYNGIVLTVQNDSLEMRQKVFDVDIGMVCRPDSPKSKKLVVVIIDDFDPGSIFEMGGAGILKWLETNNWEIRKRKDVPYSYFPEYEYLVAPDTIAYSDVSGRGLNVMLQMACSGGFANGLEQLREQLQRYKDGREPANFLEFKRGDFV